MKNRFETPGSGFNEIKHLDKGEEYAGNADFVMFVGSDDDIPAADMERNENHGSKRVDLVVCEDAREQAEKLIASGKNAVVYIFGEPSEVEGD